MKQPYDIRIHPPQISKEAIEQHRDFDALLQQFQASQPYEVQENPPQLSSKAIEKHKNFDALLQQFQQATPTPSDNQPAPKVAFLNRTLVKYGLGALLAIAASVTLVMMIGKTFNSEPSPYQETVLALDAPLPELKKDFTRFEVDADKGDTVQHRTGSRIIVPASAFVDKSGNRIKGKVAIEYREFNDHVDMFLAGVPKQQDQHQNLQSVGMMQIQGYQEGQPVFIEEGKELAVEMPMTIPADIPTETVKVFAFNAQENVWQSKGADRIEVLATASTETTGNNTPQQPQQPNGTEKDYDKALAQATADIEQQFPAPNKPLSPAVHDPNRPVFDLGFEDGEFPEVSHYKGILWELTPGQTFKDEWGAEDKYWAYMRVERKEYGVYEVHFGDDKETVKLRVTPVFKTEQQRRQMQTLYESELADYQRQLNERDTKVAMALADWKQQNGKRDDTAPQPQTPVVVAGSGTIKKIINRFSIDRFGLWNCGNPVQVADAWRVDARFVSAKGRPIAVQQIFMSNNAQRLYYFAAPDQAASAHIAYDPQAQSVLWAMTADRQILVATKPPKQLTDKQYEFELVAAPTLASEEAVRKILGGV